MGGHTQSRSQGKLAVQEEREAILRIFKEQTEETRITEVLTDLSHFGERIQWHEVALQLDRSFHSSLACESDTRSTQSRNSETWRSEL